MDLKALFGPTSGAEPSTSHHTADDTPHCGSPCLFSAHTPDNSPFLHALSPVQRVVGGPTLLMSAVGPDTALKGLIHFTFNHLRHTILFLLQIRRSQCIRRIMLLEQMLAMFQPNLQSGWTTALTTRVKPPKRMQLRQTVTALSSSSNPATRLKPQSRSAKSHTH